MSVRALAEAVRRYTDAQGGAGTFATAVDGLTLHRADHERRPAFRVFTPALCVVAQGRGRRSSATGGSSTGRARR